MKNFFQFLSESTAVQQAKRMGLVGDGHGGWYDKKGEFVAKTEKGQLKFYNKRQRDGKQDQPNTDVEKRLSQATSSSEIQEPQGPPEVEKTKGTLTIAFGRFNPPTTGHEKLLDTVASSSDEGDYIIVPSRSQDKKKNPLDPDTKVEIMKQMYPGHSGKIVNDPGNRTIFDVLKRAHTDGYAGVRILGGADRVKEFEKLANDYNGKLYNFDNVEVLSAGGDYNSFRKGVPTSMNDKQAKELYNTLRTAMGIKEGWSLWQIAPKFDWKNLRENFVKKNIYRVGDIVENLNTGLVGKIIRRGTNYLICVTEDDIMFKSWIKDVTDVSGVPANQREVGTDALRKYAETMVKGSSWGRQFINKYKKK